MLIIASIEMCGFGTWAQSSIELDGVSSGNTSIEKKVRDADATSKSSLSELRGVRDRCWLQSFVVLCSLPPARLAIDASRRCSTTQMSAWGATATATNTTNTNTLTTLDACGGAAGGSSRSSHSSASADPFAHHRPDERDRVKLAGQGPSHRIELDAGSSNR